MSDTSKVVNLGVSIFVTILYWAMEWIRTALAYRSKTAHPYFKLLLFFLLLLGSKPLLPIDL